MPEWDPKFENSVEQLVRNEDYLLVNDNKFECRKNRNNPSGLQLPTTENATFRYLISNT